MSYAMAGALGADDCKLDGDCWRACYAGGPTTYERHEACVAQCKVGPGCPKPATPIKWWMIGGGVVVAGAIAVAVIRKRK